MAATPSALAAPGAGSGIVVSSTDRCRVSLVAVSYDDPGADDAEFVELRVDGLRGADLGASLPGLDMSVSGSSAGAPAGPDLVANDADACHDPLPPPGADAATPLDAGVPDGAAPSVPTLGDCGLGELRLVDGSGGSCEEYRTIPLADIAVPRDGFIVLCPAASGVDARAHCDVTAAGRSALRAGWLQNGPSDGLRFVDTAARTTLQIAYEGTLACFGNDAPSLAVESGEVGAGTDDVNAACDGRFVLLPEGDVVLRGAVRCPAPQAADAMAPEGTLDGGVAPTVDGAAPWGPERAPAPPATAAATAPRTPTSVLFDAGAVTPVKAPGAFPSPPGCAVGRGGPPNTALLVLFAAGLLRRRTRRTPAASVPSPAARARCGVRSGSGQRR